MPQDKVSILLPDLRPGGAERVGMNLANAFVARGVAVDMVLMRKQGELLDVLDPRIRVVDLCAPRPRHVLLPLVRYLHDSRPTALLANMWPLTILAVLARWKSRVRCRLVAVEHTTWSASRLVRRWRTRMMIKTTMHWLLPRADAVLAVSKGAAADLEQFAGLPAGLVRAQYNPATQGDVVTEPSFPESFQPWAGGKHKRVLAAGTLKEVKDFPVLLRAFARLRDKVDVRLLILGEGEERTTLEALIQELDLQQTVFLPGFVPDTTSFHAHADLFVLSSSNEGFGNVIVEALEQGTPVVSTDCFSGPAEILEGGRYGTLVPVGDVEALAQAMQDSLLRHHDSEVLKRRAQDFSVDKIAEQYLDMVLPNWRDRVSDV